MTQLAFRPISSLGLCIIVLPAANALRALHRASCLKSTSWTTSCLAVLRFMKNLPRCTTNLRKYFNCMPT